MYPSILSLRQAAAAALAVLAAALVPPLAGSDGDLDPTFVSDLRRASSGLVIHPVVQQPDGRLLAFGSFFTNAGGVTSLTKARLQLDGATDPTFTTSFTVNGNPAAVACGAVQSDGKTLLGGSFDNVGGSPRSCVVRLNADGSVDPTFVPAAITASGAVTAIALQSDGKVLILGFFTNVGGQPRTRMARLNADGSLDSAFNPVFTRTASTVNLSVVEAQDDGKILVGGTFTHVNGDPRANFVRLNADGTNDALLVDTNNSVTALALESNGRCTLGGTFTLARGLPYARSVRINADGSLDATYVPVTPPNISGIRALALQVDGKMLVGGSAAAVGAAGPFHRLNPDGSLDSSFVVPTALRHFGGGVAYLGMQFDGRILLGRTTGTDWTADDNPLPLLRLRNEGGVQSLAVDATSVRWLRSGALPEARDVVFQVSTDGGQNWTTLAVGSRIAGGWEATGLSLPMRGLVRALFRPVMGSVQAAIPQLAHVQPFHLNGPEIAIEQPAHRPIAQGGSRHFGSQRLGDSATLTFTVHNFGATNLSGLGLSITGPNAADFSALTFPVPPLSGPSGVSDFTVRFRPTTPGPKTATLFLANNTPGRDPFQIVLTGTALADGTAQLLTGAEIPPNPNDYVRGSVVQPDGRAIVFGEFNSAGGRTRSGIFRLDAAGRIESAYDPNVSGRVRAAVLQADGRLVIAGAFGSVGGQPRSNLARLHADGTLDTTFAAGADAEVYALALQPDGKVLAAGAFAQANGTDRGRVARFLADGTLDPAFLDPQGDGFVFGLRLLPDGKVVLLGTFMNVGGTSQRFIGQLNADGSRVPGYAPEVAGFPLVALPQPDGKLLVGGAFSSINGGAGTGYLVRLLADGTVDAGFNAAVSSFVYSLALQGDGRILVAGAFTQAGGQTRLRTVRLHADGSADASFVADTQANVGDSAVFSVGLLPDGQILSGGAYDTVNGVTTTNFARLANTLATPALSVTGADTLDWQRGGTAPQVQWVEFELSTNGGGSWAPLGMGGPVAGGWRLSGLALPQVGTVRARGLVPSGEAASSSGFVEQTVSFSLTPLQIWRALQSLPSDGSGDAGNPSGDGTANLLRYAFNTAPLAGDLLTPSVAVLPPGGSAGLPAITRDAQGRLHVEFVRRKAGTNPGILYRVETGDDLNALAALDLTAAQVSSIDATWERVSVADPALTPRRFGRVRVTVGN